MEKFTSIDGKEVAVIKILPNKRSYNYDKGLYRKHALIPLGRLYIETNSHAFRKIEYRYVKNPRSNSVSELLILTSLGRPILYQDTYIYEPVDGIFHLSYMERDQADEVMQTDYFNELQSEEFGAYHYIIKQFVRSHLTIDESTNDSNLYSPYQYDSDFWQQKNFVYESEKEEQKIISDLESGGDTLEEQFRKNGQQK